MKRLIFIFTMAAFSLVSYGQTVKENNDSISQIKKLSIRPQNEQLNTYLQMDKPHSMDTVHGLDIAIPLYNPADRDVKVKLPSLNIYEGPLWEEPPINIHFPYSTDYAYRGVYGLSDRASIGLSSSNTTFPPAARVRMARVELNYKVADWMYVSGGPYASKYSVYPSEYNTQFNSMYTSHYNDFGATGAMKFIITDRIRINAYGQYSINADRNHIGGPMLDMYPHTYYGGTVEFKITDKFGIEGGMIRELNPFNGKWENRPIIIPVFYK